MSTLFLRYHYFVDLVVRFTLSAAATATGFGVPLTVSGAGDVTAAAVVATPLATPVPVAPAAKARKLSFKEQRELDALPDLIAALEAEQKEIADLLADGSLYGSDNARALTLAARSAQIDDELMAALERSLSPGHAAAAVAW